MNLTLNISVKDDNLAECDPCQVEISDWGIINIVHEEFGNIIEIDFEQLHLLYKTAKFLRKENKENQKVGQIEELLDILNKLVK